MVGENTAGSAVLRPPHNELVTPLLTGEGAPAAARSRRAAAAPLFYAANDRVA